MDIEEKKWAPQTEEGKKFIHDLRNYMRDTADLNLLLDEEEVDDRALVLSIRMAVSEYNNVPPFLNTSSFKDILAQGLFAPMLRLCAAIVLESKWQWQERNNLNYSDGGSSESVNDKAPSYKDTAARLRQMAMESFSNFKLARNMSNGYGSSAGLGSDYSYINDYI